MSSMHKVHFSLDKGLVTDNDCCPAGVRSSSCELAAQRLAVKLGSAEAALDRFADSQAPPGPDLQSQKPAAAASAPVYAAGAADMPIMLSKVKVCRTFYVPTI
jgi:hypothetical protein